MRNNHEEIVCERARVGEKIMNDSVEDKNGIQRTT